MVSSKKGSREAVHIGQGDFCGKYDEVTVIYSTLCFDLFHWSSDAQLDSRQHSPSSIKSAGVQLLMLQPVIGDFEDFPDNVWQFCLNVLMAVPFQQQRWKQSNVGVTTTVSQTTGCGLHPQSTLIFSLGQELQTSQQCQLQPTANTFFEPDSTTSSCKKS